MAGGMFTISYTIAVIVPVDLRRVLGSHRTAVDAFVPHGAVRVALTVFGTVLILRKAPQ